METRREQSVITELYGTFDRGGENWFDRKQSDGHFFEHPLRAEALEHLRPVEPTALDKTSVTRRTIQHPAWSAHSAGRKTKRLNRCLRAEPGEERPKLGEVLGRSKRLREGKSERRDERLELEAEQYARSSDPAERGERRRTRENRRPLSARGDPTSDLGSDRDRREQVPRVAQPEFVGNREGRRDRTRHRRQRAAPKPSIVLQGRDKSPVDERRLGRRKLLA